jgi:hypothetical protein
LAAQVAVNNRYRLDERPLARGGMGEIWTARDLRLDRTVVVKLIRSPDGEPDTELLHRFQREARLTARLDHPGVPAVYDIGVHLGRPYLVMQLIRGINVADVNAEQAPLPIAWAATIGAQVSSVLIAAHHMGLIHRDLKPGNLMLDRDGAVKVLDFGLAAALGGSDVSRITHTGQSIGTPAYMAPEQVAGADTTHSTDLYGLGCTLFDLLAGRPPFTAPNSYAVMRQHVDARPPRLRELRTDVPEQLEEVVLALMEKRPEDRPSSASAVYDALAPFLGDLPGLPGVLTAETDAIRAYAAVIGRLPAGIRTHDEPQFTSGPMIDRPDIDRARQDALELVRASQHGSAARILSAVIDSAARAFGEVDDDTLSLRAMYADVLLDAGELRAAARQYRALARNLAERHGPDADQVLECRLRAARTHVMLGETERARIQLVDLLRDQVRINGSDHPAAQNLNREIDLLGTLDT